MKKQCCVQVHMKVIDNHYHRLFQNGDKSRDHKRNSKCQLFIQERLIFVHLQIVTQKITFLRVAKVLPPKSLQQLFTLVRIEIDKFMLYSDQTIFVVVIYTYGEKSKGKNSDPYSLFEARIQNRNWLIGLSSYHPNNINNYNILLLTSNFFSPKGSIFAS